MKAREVVGKKIARVVFEYTKDQIGDRVQHVRRIEFADGSFLYFRVVEIGSEYAVEGHFGRKAKS